VGSDGKPRAVVIFCSPKLACSDEETKIKMNKYDAAVFDMDGTILDTLKDLAAAMNYGLRAVGYPERTVDEARRFLGNGAERLMREALPPDTDETTFAAALAAFKEYYLPHCEDTTKPYPGIADLLRALRKSGIKTAVVSNKIDPAVGELAEKYFPGLLDAAVGERAGVRKKPAPDTVLTVLEELGIPKSRAVYIGDSEVDVETAENAGLPSIIVTWGFRKREFLETLNCGAIVDTTEELAKELGLQSLR
jgi:phosphoglycolate phosphatase